MSSLTTETTALRAWLREFIPAAQRADLLDFCATIGCAEVINKLTAIADTLYLLTVETAELRGACQEAHKLLGSINVLKIPESMAEQVHTAYLAVDRALNPQEQT